MKFSKLSVALAGIGLSVAAIAAEETTPPQKVERIEVTGSNIRRAAVEGPSPVQVIRKEEIESSGASTVVELMSLLPSVTGFFSGSSSNSFSQGAAAASLRGLGEKNVLVLLNGRRLVNYGYANNIDSSFVDLNAIPLSAIEQVEVLRDGASAIYGSDAVAGVINFKTKRNYQGLEVAGRYGQHVDGGGQEHSASISAGFGDLSNDRFNVLLTADVFQREPTFDRDHKYTKSTDYRPYGGTDSRATNAFPGSYELYDTALGRQAMGGCLGSVEQDDRGDWYCRTESAAYTQTTPRTTRTGTSGIFSFALTPDTTLFSELAFNRNVTDYESGFASIGTFNSGNTKNADRLLWPGDAAYPTSVPIRYFDDNGVLQQENIDPDADAGSRVMVFRSVYEAGQVREKTTSDTARAVFGVKGNLADWDYETSIGYGHNKVKTVESGKLKTDAITDAYLNGGYDPFKLWNSAADVQKLLTSTTRAAESKLMSAELKASNPELFNLMDSPVGFAWGLQAYKDSIKDTPDAQTIAGNIENQGATAVSGDRRVLSAYGELAFNPIKQLEIQLALRHDRYSDFGGTTNPKLSFAFRPMQEVLLRGTATTSFKAPTLPQLYMAESTAYTVVADWVRCGPLGYGPGQCQYSSRLKIHSNPDLQPEESKNFALGIVLSPTRNLTTSFDWYRIEQKNTIETLNAQYILDHEYNADGTKNPAFANLIERSPRNPALEAQYPGLKDGRLIGEIVPFMNVGKQNVSGFDWGLIYSFQLLNIGRLTINNQYSRLLKLQKSDIPSEAPRSRLDDNYNPEWRNSLNIELASGPWSYDTTTRTVASTYDMEDILNLDATTPRLSSYTSVDLNVGYKGIKNTVVNVGVQNLFARAPRFSKDGDAFQDSVTGRFAYASLRYTFK
ncbi:TonB-dependent receptor plug domain-containing protein [Chitinimonas koreensis]|uniref:TonB-dependent receptor plug domain-containing protein n=1 Tax=Chitinimonas koreensis TaxID=356302 RepID=UPI00040039AE|nr:TonB-dependent receptor [Chitinimonas koreensis]QNM95873.1 TonB-dependent receptor [Chitinimonas koreensis]